MTSCYSHHFLSFLSTLDRWENEIRNVKIMELTVNNNELKAANTGRCQLLNQLEPLITNDTETRPNIVRLRNL